jgi:hypothetical protein
MEEQSEESNKNDGHEDMGVPRSPTERGHDKKRKSAYSGDCEPSSPPSIDRITPSKSISAEPEFSSSVSFWWGRRILKK